MNTATITGTVSTVPTFKHRGFVPTTDFEVTVLTGRRCHTLHVSYEIDHQPAPHTEPVGGER